MHSADTPLLPTMGMDHLVILMIPGAAQGFLPTSLPTPPPSSRINHNNCRLITPLGFWPCSCSSPVPGLGSKRKPKEKAMECPKSRAGLERMREGWILTAPPCRAPTPWEDQPRAPSASAAQAGWDAQPVLSPALTRTYQTWAPSPGMIKTHLWLILLNL